MPPQARPSAATIAVAVPGTATDGRYAVVDVAISARSRLPTHVHRHEELHLVVLAGVLRLTQDGRPRTLGRGEHAHLPAHVPWQAGADAGTRILVIVVPAGAERLAGLLARGHDEEDRAAVLAAAGIDRVPAARSSVPDGAP